MVEYGKLAAMLGVGKGRLKQAAPELVLRKTGFAIG
eukprot:SAG11_NODE_27456_length_332_cov_1.115880_1_plen_35_part_01